MKQILIGVLKWNPELRYTASGKALCSLTVTIEGGKDITCTAWESLGEEIAAMYRTYKPGVRVRLDGYYKTREWRDREGNLQSRQEFNTKAITAMEAHDVASGDS